jgi:endonuclease/exonuclease/phosphatase family metal-dependent hydrolase
MQRSIHLITLNCQRGERLGELEYYLSDLVREKEIDFLLLQEVDPKVAHILNKILKRSFSYQIVQHQIPETGKQAEVVILYNPKFALVEYTYHSYKRFLPKKSKETGAVVARFTIPADEKTGQREIIVCSSHLHAAYHYKARMRELQYIKNEILALNNDERICIIGGDFNYLMPGELNRGNRIMEPDFVHVTDYDQHSCDSSLLESTEFQNKLFLFLSRIGLKFLLKIDHMYVDRDSFEKGAYETNVIDVLVSDHRPVETIIRLKSMHSEASTAAVF